jgi:hypothetical protein
MHIASREIRQLSDSEAEMVSGGWLPLVIEILTLTGMAAQATGPAPTVDDAKAYLEKGK